MTSRHRDFSPTSGHLSPSEAIVHGLAEISRRSEASFETRARDLLRLGLERFELDVGLLSRVTGPNYSVTAWAGAKGSVVAPRERALLEDTLCGITLERDAATWVACPEGQTPPTHLGIAAAAYLGVPIWLGPVPYGTLSFAGVELRDRAFDQGDRDCLEVMASWLSLDLRLQRTLDELDQAQKKLRGFVRMDPLTELLNRDAVLRSFERYAERAGFTGTSLACLVVGIDGLHLINEDFGDATGDRVLRAVATRVRDSLRPSDVAGRVGDAEFLAILPEANLDDAERVAERISRSVELLIVNAKEEAFGLTVSIAVSRVPLGRTNVAEVLAEAEILLRKSRASGGGRIGVNKKVG